MHNGYNYRTLNPWEQTALEHLSAMIGEIIGAGFEDPSCLMERVSNMVLELSYWDTPNNHDDSVTNLPNNAITVNEEIEAITSSYSDTQPKYIYYGASGEDGDKEINPSWGDSEEEETQVPGFQDIDYETAYIYANRPDPEVEDEDDIPY
ncbi:MAG: hypothetical protein RID09_21470 [Coleofasciculus sp. G1-WW12-02]|uniref:hypothetical protein n=1 Tax=Coleofasciculus sp. G1-WW12-02 TaxID=3068483 RepID=UPI0033009899